MRVYVCVHIYICIDVYADIYIYIRVYIGLSLCRVCRKGGLAGSHLYYVMDRVELEVHRSPHEALLGLLYHSI